MNHEKETDRKTNQGDTSEFKRVRSQVFKSKFGISYEDAQQIATWTGSELQAYWKKAVEYFDDLIKGGE